MDPTTFPIAPSIASRTGPVHSALRVLLDAVDEPDRDKRRQAIIAWWKTHTVRFTLDRTVDQMMLMSTLDSEGCLRHIHDDAMKRLGNEVGLAHARCTELPLDHRIPGYPEKCWRYEIDLLIP